MSIRHSNLKEEVLDLFGSLSVEEIIKNHNLQLAIADISKNLQSISIVEKYNSNKELKWKK